MTKEEIKDIGILRIGWDDDGTLPGFVIDPQTTNSGRFFQDEHPAVTLENIRDCQPVEGISDVQFNTYLEKLKTKCVYQVLSDSLEKNYVDDDLLDLYPDIFDQAILYRMVINVSELILTSTRTNDIARFNRNFIGKLNYDLYRDTVQKFASLNKNYRYTMGIAARYDYEIMSLQRRLGAQRNLLDTITKGRVTNPFIQLNDSDYEPPLS